MSLGRFLGSGYFARRNFVRVRRCILCFDLSDSATEGFVLRTRLGKLTIYPQRQLLVALLEIELGHGLIDEWLTRCAGESLLDGRRLIRRRERVRHGLSRSR